MSLKPGIYKNSIKQKDAKLVFWFFFAFLLLAIPGIVWLVQTTNFGPLKNQIGILEDQVNQSSTLELKDELSLKKDLLIIKKDVINAQNAVYGTVAQIIGGLFFFVTAYFTWRNVKATEDKQIAERFSKAVEQLQSEKPGVPLGGIYALERIAKDSESDYWTIIEVLSAFIRQSSVDHQKPINFAAQEALKVIGRLNSSQKLKGKIIDLRDANLTNGNFAEANLEGINFRGADFTGAILSGAILNKASLLGANFTGANLQCTYLSDVNSGVDFLRESNKSVKFDDAYLSGADFTKAQLACTTFKNAEMINANLSEAILVNAQFNNANLTNANLSQADLTGANVIEAILQNTNLNKAILTSTIGLNTSKIRLARNWQTAKYNKQFSQTLGL